MFTFHSGFYFITRQLIKNHTLLKLDEVRFNRSTRSEVSTLFLSLEPLSFIAKECYTPLLNNVPSHLSTPFWKHCLKVSGNSLEYWYRTISAAFSSSLRWRSFSFKVDFKTFAGFSSQCESSSVIFLFSLAIDLVGQNRNMNRAYCYKSRTS